MDGKNERNKGILKAIQFGLPAAAAAVLITIGLLSLPKVPTELPEKLVYTPPTSAPTEAPIETAPPSDEPVITDAPVTDEPMTEVPTQEPTETPANSAEPSETPTAEPTAVPTAVPTAGQTAAPTTAPTSAPTAAPTTAPTVAPTAAPTAVPTAAPTAAPTEVPGKYRDGDYKATAQCRDPELFDYTVEVTVKVRSGDVAEVTVIKTNDNSDDPDTNDIFLKMAVEGDGANAGVPAGIVAHNGVEGVDVVSGATYSSNAILSAAGKALKNAEWSVSVKAEYAILPENRFRFRETERRSI